MSHPTRSDGLVFLLLAASAAYFVYAWASNRVPPDVYSIDIYYYYYPNMLHAAAAVRDHGRGLFWNPFQSCGQPFLGLSSTGVLYPVNALFLLFDADLAFRMVTAANLTIAGVSAYLLCRELGLHVASAVCGALAFAYGSATVNLTTWSPLAGNGYVWLPAMLLGCERILRAPSIGRGVALAVVIAIALLPGFPQGVLFAYQIMALRVLWELARGRISQPRVTFLAFALAFSLPVLLTAVQLVPALEAQQLSVRAGGLSTQEMGAGFSWRNFLTALTFRSEVGNPVILVPCILASCSLINPRTRSVALFYALSGFLFVALSLGPGTPVFWLYTKLPLGNLFRMPIRFLWVTSFCLSVLTACGVESLVAPRDGPPAWPQRVLPAALLLVSAFTLRWLSPWSTAEWVVATATLAAGVVALTVPALRGVAAGTIVVALTLNLLAFPLPALGSLALRPFPLARLIPDGVALTTPRPVFAELRPRVTSNDRAYLVYSAPATGHELSLLDLGPKTAGAFGIAAIHDYEPQPAQRYADYYMLMRTGRPMRGVGEYYLQFGGMMPPGFRRRLLDLAAARYLVVEPAADTTANALDPPPRLLWEGHGLRLYENAQALPRAFFVPRVETVSGPEELLDRLANGDDDLRQVALVESEPASGFVGGPGKASEGSVEFLRDDPEHVVLRVSASARGFVHLADQYFPGWSATVNGAPAAIARANYLFRLVEVPAGDSIVEFRYRPWSLGMGAVVSAVTCVGLAGVFFFTRTEGRRHTRSM